MAGGTDGRPTLRSLVREDIDRAIRQAFTLQSLWRILESWGYDIKQGQHLAVRPPGGKRFLRLESLGPGYTEAVLLQRIARNRIKRVDRSRPKKLRYPGPVADAASPSPAPGLSGPVLPVPVPAAGEAHRPAPFVVRREVFRLRQTVEQYQLLREHRIDTTSQLEDFQKKLEQQIAALVERRQPLYRAGRKEEIAHINEELRPLRKQLRLCGAIAQRVSPIRESLRCERNERNPREKQRNRGERTWR